jgi:hypothetical protein
VFHRGKGPACPPVAELYVLAIRVRLSVCALAQGRVSCSAGKRAGRVLSREHSHGEAPGRGAWVSPVGSTWPSQQVTSIQPGAAAPYVDGLRRLGSAHHQLFFCQRHKTSPPSSPPPHLQFCLTLCLCPGERMSFLWGY